MSYRQLLYDRYHNKKSTYCDICNGKYKLYNYKKHIKTNKHLDNLKHLIHSKLINMSEFKKGESCSKCNKQFKRKTNKHKCKALSPGPVDDEKAEKKEIKEITPLPSVITKKEILLKKPKKKKKNSFALMAAHSKQKRQNKKIKQ